MQPQTEGKVLTQQIEQEWFPDGFWRKSVESRALEDRLALPERREGASHVSQMDQAGIHMEASGNTKQGGHFSQRVLQVELPYGKILVSSNTTDSTIAFSCLSLASVHLASSFSCLSEPLGHHFGHPWLIASHSLLINHFIHFPPSLSSYHSSHSLLLALGPWFTQRRRPSRNPLSWPLNLS